MKNSTLETLNRTKNRKSSAEVIAQYQDRVTVCPDAKNYRTQSVKVKGTSDYYQRKYQRGV
jgi:hypothetical protein